MQSCSCMVREVWTSNYFEIFTNIFVGLSPINIWKKIKNISYFFQKRISSYMQSLNSYAIMCFHSSISIFKFYLKWVILVELICMLALYQIQNNVWICLLTLRWEFCPSWSHPKSCANKNIQFILTTEIGVPAMNVFFLIILNLLILFCCCYRENFFFFINRFWSHHFELYNTVWQYFILNLTCRQERNYLNTFSCKLSP